jgi:hypothetical protein
MLPPLAITSDVLLLGRDGFFSEPFLLAMFGALLILTGEVIRQHGRQKRSVQAPKSASQESIIVTPFASARSQHRADAQGLPAWNERRGSLSGDLVESTQLWLPLSAAREASEGNPEVMHR